MEFAPYLSKHCHLHLNVSSIGIRILSFQTLEFHLILLKIGVLNIGIRTLSLQTLEFAPYPFIICIWILSLQKLEFAPYPFKHWNLNLVLTNIEIRTLSF